MTIQTEHTAMVNLFISLLMQPDADLSMAQILMMENHVRECAECAVLAHPTGCSREERGAGFHPHGTSVVRISDYLLDKSRWELNAQ